MFKSKIFLIIVIGYCLVICFIIEAAQAQGLNFLWTSIDPKVNRNDGRVTFDAEWESASAKLDINNEGTAYAQVKFNWLATSSSGNQTTYPGVTAFVLHDISQYVTQEIDDYNVFHFTHQCGLKVVVYILANGDALDDSSWLPYSGLADSWLIPEGDGPNKIIDTGFIVRLNNNPLTDRHWFPGMPEPGDPTFNWFDWYGVIGTSGFNDSAFQHGLPFSVPGSNEVYELAIHEPPCEEPLGHCIWILMEFHDRKDGVAGVGGWDPILIIEPCHITPIEPNKPPEPNEIRILSEPPEPPPVTDPGALELDPWMTYPIFITSEFSGVTPIFSSSAATVLGAEFVDHGDGTATLTITPLEHQMGKTFKVGVVATNGVVDSNILMFGYKVPMASGRAYNPNPADTSTVSPNLLLLSWTNPNPYQPGGIITCDVYLGTTEPNYSLSDYGYITLIAGTTDNFVTLPPGTLQIEKTYYWIVDVHDSSLGPDTSHGFLWAFNTDNMAPVVNVADDQYLWLNNTGDPASATAYLDGTVIDDDYPAPYTVLWTQVSGPATVLIDPSNHEDVQVSLPLTGYYVFCLEADDGELSTSDTVQVYVGETACTAAQAMPSYTRLPGDLNNDCFVGLTDFAVFADNWLGCSSLAPCY
jgi:hypothetical protein